MGKKLIIPGITSFTGPKIYADPIMSKGSLLLWDPTHPAGGDAAGVVNGAPLINIAADIAASILGLAESAARPVIVNDAGVPHAASLKQRTAKGGLYSVYSHLEAAGTLTGFSHLGVGFAAAREYMFNHRHDHAFFGSVWIRTLRKGRQGSQNAAQFVMISSSNAQASTNYVLGADGASLGAVGFLGQRHIGQNSYNGLWDVDAPRIMNMARQLPPDLWVSGAFGTSLGPIAVMGSYGAWIGANCPGPSGIIERFYIEDLTVSGRTYAEVDTIDFALFNAAHAPGGAWHGDSYTDPATLP